MTQDPAMPDSQDVTGLVERLNDWAVYAENEITVHAGPYTIDGDMRQAATLILSLAAEREEMRRALEGDPEMVAALDRRRRAEKLTKAQRAMLIRARDERAGEADGDGCYIWGRHEMRTANALVERGLIKGTANGYATLTEAGRQSLNQGTRS